VLSIASRGAAGAARWTEALGIPACAAALTLAVAALTLGTSTAQAETFPAGCSNLQEQITVASEKEHHGEGQVVVLNGLCKAGVTVPSESNIAIEGAPGTTSGFDGEGVSGAFVSSGAVGAVTLADLTFENAKSTTSPAVKPYAVRATLRDDAFSEDSLEGEGGSAGAQIETSSCATPPSSPTVTVNGSSFTGDKLEQTGFGGALYIGNGCIGSTTVLDGDRFEGNTLEGPSSSELVGGGMEFAGVGDGSFPVSQEHDVFDSNRILANGAGAGNRGGGGEWLQGASLTSVADRFSRNTIPGTTGSHWSWGGGIGIINTLCGKEAPTESTLEDDVVAGNSIGAGTAADLGGAGIYVGCPPESATPNHLRLLDSTVTENSVATAGGVAGIDGHSSDQLVIENSIVASVEILLEPPVVDIGASEYEPTTPVTGVSVPACLPPRLFVPGTSASIFSFPSLAVHTSGLLALSFTNLTAGRLQVLGTFKVARTLLRRVQGQRRHVKKLETIVYGRASCTMLSPGNVKIELKPTKRALALLARRKHLRVLLSITFTGTNEAPTTHTQTITVKYMKPHRRHHS
jgi:hypothetical protein